jgi:hypothetical protein
MIRKSVQRFSEKIMRQQKHLNLRPVSQAASNLEPAAPCDIAGRSLKGLVPPI